MLFINLLWSGILLMALGFGLSLRQRRDGKAAAVAPALVSKPTVAVT